MEEAFATSFSVDGARKVNAADFPAVCLLIAMETSVNISRRAGTPMGHCKSKLRGWLHQTRGAPALVISVKGRSRGR